MKKLVYGFGLNDVDFPVYYYVDGKRTPIPSYRSWYNMLERCYSKRVHARYPTYIDCYVCDEWLIFSNFHEWYCAQYKEPGWNLDKDIIKKGNKVYCPELCAMIPAKLNKFILDNPTFRGKHLIGVSMDKGRYRSCCKNPFTEKFEHIGSFSSEMEAHLAWKSRKHELAMEWSSMVEDPRIIKSLESMYI